jgi:hypothetical protein
MTNDSTVCLYWKVEKQIEKRQNASGLISFAFLQFPIEASSKVGAQ